MGVSGGQNGVSGGQWDDYGVSGAQWDDYGLASVTRVSEKSKR